jgi:hypothetical protein
MNSIEPHGVSGFEASGGDGRWPVEVSARAGWCSFSVSLREGMGGISEEVAVAVEHWDPRGESAVGCGRGPVTVVVAENSFLVREALVRLLSADARVRVVGLAVDYDSALNLVGELDPDVVVTDVRMPPSQTDEGIRLAAALRVSRPTTR